MKARGVAILAGGLMLLAPLLFRGQEVNITPRPKPAPKEEAQRPANIRVNTNLVLIPVTVNDPLNRPVSGLEKENFKVYDDKAPQTITTFAMDDEPIGAGLVFDTSGSMGEKLKRSRMAATVFFKIADPEDEFFLVEFDDRPRLVVPLTKDYGRIEEELTFSRSRGSTALLDAIYMALQEMRKSKKNKKTLLIISDGGDNNSRYSVKEVKDLIQESDVLIYAIGVFGGGSTPEEAGGPELLSHIAEQTGGRMFFANPADLPDVAKKIGIELRNRYILGYSPENQQRDGKYHRVEVKVIPPRGLPRLQAHWRVGYNAPDH
jgi:Ca-activated chloride channel family protein